MPLASESAYFHLEMNQGAKKEIPDCKTCEHALVLYRLDKEDRFQSSYSPTGYVRCSGPRYKGRAFFCRDDKTACTDYAKKERTI
jgi:ssDNA-binding Zn-finger/Zn-ribbon topoisomerase 1